MTRRHAQPRTSARTFIMVWQSSDTFEEAAKHTRLSTLAAMSRYRYYTKHGVKLKDLPKIRKARQRLDWIELALLAQEQMHHTATHA